MEKKYSNRCYRCGKERVVVKTWKEDIGVSEVTVTQMICPDPECQKVVAKEIKAQADKARIMAKRREDKILGRRKPKKATTR
jgi:hypothetical protein